MIVDNNYEKIYLESPSMLSVNLYKYNYYDNLLISEIKRKAILYKNDKKFISLSSVKLMNILQTSFKEELSITNTFPADRVGHSMTTIYQVYSLLKYYANLKIINFNISYDRNYTKIIDGDKGNKLIVIDYKIDKIILHYDRILSDNGIKLFNNMLKEINVITTIKPLSSYSLYYSDYITALNNIKDKEKYKVLTDLNSRILTDKIKIDNPIINIITDF